MPQLEVQVDQNRPTTATAPTVTRQDVFVGGQTDSSDLNATVALKAPNFGSLTHIYAATSRIAGRLNAASISESEQNLLLRQRQELLDRKFEGKITREEENRLQYVRWSLDRIEDAKYGRVLDALEEQVARYERFEAGMSSLATQLREALQNNQGGNTGRRGRR